MAETSKTLAIELKCSERQVLNYKVAVETHLGFSITRRQGKKHFYLDEYVDLVRKYSRGEPLPPFVAPPSVNNEPFASSIEVLPPEHPNLSVKKGAGVPAKANNRQIVFSASDLSSQREKLIHETEEIADTTFANLGGLRQLLRHVTVEGFRNAAVLDLRDGIAAYQEELNQGMERVATAAKKGGFASDLTA